MNELEQLAQTRDGLQLYNAGLPAFPRNFTRDSVIAALLYDDMAMMAAQIRFGALHQGQRNDATSGEERGKIFHEYPGVRLRDRSTQFNGCDTTGLWLYGLAQHEVQAGNLTLLSELHPQVRRAIDYLLAHVDERGLFVESPSFCGAERFALRVTYWKDSVVFGRKGGEPTWPAVFTLAHVQNMAGLRAIGELLGDEPLLATAQNMLSALDLLWDDALGGYVVALDGAGPIRVVTSDLLHMLAYLRVGDLSAETLTALSRTSQTLETDLGYRAMPAGASRQVDYDYHAKTVWPFEQAMIHLGASRFGLQHVQQVSQRVVPHIQHNAPETLKAEPDVHSRSCDPQLWTVAARDYFARIK